MPGCIARTTQGENYCNSPRLDRICVGAISIKCEFSQPHLARAGKAPSSLSAPSMGRRMDMGPGGFSRFVRCSFHNVTIRNWICLSVEMIDCTFSGRLDTAVFNGTVPEDKRGIIGRASNEFHGNDFSAMNLVDVAFRTGIDLTKQVLPSGEDYLYLPQAAAAVARARSEVVSRDDQEMRRAATTIIQGLEYELSGGQNQLLLRLSDFYRVSAIPRKAVDRFFAMLRQDGAA